MIEPVGGAGSHPGSEDPVLECEAPEHLRLEVDAELPQVHVPVVEPCVGGRPVEHAVGLAVVAVECHVELDVGADVGPGIAEAGVEAGEDLGHIEDLSRERGAVAVALDTRVRVDPDEELVGRHVFELLGTTLGRRHQEPQDPTEERRDVALGEAELADLVEHAVELGNRSRRLAGKHERGQAIECGHRLRDHPLHVVVHRARGHLRGRDVMALVVDGNALKHVPEVEVVRGEEAEAVFADRTRRRIGRAFRPVRPREGTEGRVLGRGHAADPNDEPVGLAQAAWIQRRLVDPHPEPSLRELVRGGQPGDSSAEHRNGRRMLTTGRCRDESVAGVARGLRCGHHATLSF